MRGGFFLHKQESNSRAGESTSVNPPTGLKPFRSLWHFNFSESIISFHASKCFTIKIWGRKSRNIRKIVKLLRSSIDVSKLETFGMPHQSDCTREVDGAFNLWVGVTSTLAGDTANGSVVVYQRCRACDRIQERFDRNNRHCSLVQLKLPAEHDNLRAVCELEQ